MKYTHRDKDGVLWRFEGSRPISEIADRVMHDVTDPLSTRNLKRQAKECWAESNKALKRAGGGDIGVGPLARANWWAGYAACLDWAVVMLNTTNKRKPNEQRLRSSGKNRKRAKV